MLAIGVSAPIDSGYQPAGITTGGLLDWSYTTDAAGNPAAIADLLDPAQSRGFAYQPYRDFLTCAAGPWSPPVAGQPLQWTYTGSASS